MTVGDELREFAMEYGIPFATFVETWLGAKIAPSVRVHFLEQYILGDLAEPLELSVIGVGEGETGYELLNVYERAAPRVRYFVQALDGAAIVGNLDIRAIQVRPAPATM